MPQSLADLPLLPGDHPFLPLFCTCALSPPARAVLCLALARQRGVRPTLPPGSLQFGKKRRATGKPLRLVNAAAQVK